MAILSCGGWLWWICRNDDNIPFLAGDGAARWILYPKAPDTVPHRGVAFSSIFRRTFELGPKPSVSKLSIRVFKAGQVSINGQPVLGLELSERNWKQSRELDVGSLLREGTNELVITVSNGQGPPALLFSLDLGPTNLVSDTDWQVSFAGAPWETAVLAADPPAIRPGNHLFGRERMGESLTRIWPVLVAMITAAALATWGARRLFSSSDSRWNGLKKLLGSPWTSLLVVLVGWLALFSNNLPRQALLFGFDRDGHIEYIDYIRAHGSLPLADQGWQMYQPPLYYVFSAIALAPFGVATSSETAVLALRAFSAIAGMAHLALIWLCLRELFPNRRAAQIAGLILAGMLPANICISHHVTNEALAALFVTAALYCSLRIARSSPGAAPWRLYFAAGICMGLALLTKFSAILAVPVIVTALMWRIAGLQDGTFLSRPGKVRSIVLLIASMLLVCGWHYARVWHRFGSPLIGNWDRQAGFLWWQEPGFHTGSWYGHFGSVFSCALFSSINGFADGIYSSLWGDGLCSGSARMDFRPPWNYDLMNAGYLLAIPWMILLGIGAVVAAVRFVRKPGANWFAMSGLLAAFAFGLVYMTLRVPSYAQVKAFYALPALLPLCAVGALGWEFVATKSRLWACVLSTWILVWASVGYGSFWIRANNPDTWTTRGTSLADDKHYLEAIDKFSKALQLDPHQAIARVRMADSLERLGRHQEALQQTEEALREHPKDPAVLSQRAIALTVDGRFNEAVDLQREAIKAAPDSGAAYGQLAVCLGWLGKFKAVIEECADGLRADPFNSELHYQLALSFASEGRTSEAVEHYRHVLGLDGENVKALNNLAWILATSASVEVRNGPEAVRFAERACELTQRREPMLVGTLAAAYAEAGRFDEAVSAGEKARDLAATTGQQELARRNDELLELYRKGKAYREKQK